MVDLVFVMIANAIFLIVVLVILVLTYAFMRPSSQENKLSQEQSKELRSIKKQIEHAADEESPDENSIPRKNPKLKNFYE